MMFLKRDVRKEEDINMGDMQTMFLIAFSVVVVILIVHDQAIKKLNNKD